MVGSALAWPSCGRSPRCMTAGCPSTAPLARAAGSPWLCRSPPRRWQLGVRPGRPRSPDRLEYGGQTSEDRRRRLQEQSVLDPSSPNLRGRVSEASNPEALSLEQQLAYARDLRRVYDSERARRGELEAANRALAAANGELDRRLYDLMAAEEWILAVNSS